MGLDRGAPFIQSPAGARPPDERDGLQVSDGPERLRPLRSRRDLGTDPAHDAPALRMEQTMKNGLKVFDTDTHAAPSAETLRPYLAAKVLERIPDLDEQRVPIRANR